MPTFQFRYKLSYKIIDVSLDLINFVKCSLFICLFSLFKRCNYKIVHFWSSVIQYTKSFNSAPFLVKSPHVVKSSPTLYFQPQVDGSEEE